MEGSEVTAGLSRTDRNSLESVVERDFQGERPWSISISTLMPWVNRYTTPGEGPALCAPVLQHHLQAG